MIYLKKKKVGEALDSEAPMKFIQNRSDHRSWLSEELLQLMRERDQSRDAVRLTGGLDYLQKTYN